MSWTAREAYGVVTGDGVITMNNRFGGHAASLREALAGDLLPRIKEAAANAKPDRKLADIKFLPVIPNPERIACAGINYRSHASETGREIPKQPSMFLRLADTLVGHEGEMIRPTISTNFDFEGELAVDHRQRRAPHPEGARARARRRLHLLRRRQRARLPEILRDLRQEFSRHRAARVRGW